METVLDLELKRLVVGTNEQRRRVGQAIFHLYKTFVFWHDKGRGFYDIASRWAVGGAAIFDSLAATLRDLEVFQEDPPLRAWLAEVLDQLALDLERGDQMLHPFIRWLESRFPDLTAMMQEEKSGSKIHDYDLALALTNVFARAADADREDMVALLRGASFEIRPAP